MPPKGSSKAPKPSTSKVPATKPASIKRKRRSVEEEEAQTAFNSVDSLGLGPDALEFGSEGEDDDGEVLEDDSDDEVVEAFPEIDGESSDGSFDGSADEDDEEEDDEAALLAELEEEDEESDGSDLDELIRRNTTKPNEGETPGTSWENDPSLPTDYMKRSKVVKSAITGGDLTQWDDEIDAGYGSDSSTEEVSGLGSPCKVFR